MVLTLILTGLLLRTVSDTSALWRMNSQRLDTFVEARAALHHIALDLASTPVFPFAPKELAVLSIQPHPLRAIPAVPGTEFALLTQSPTPEYSDLRAVGYFCDWDPDLKGPVLKRQSASAAATAESLRNLAPDKEVVFPWHILPRDGPSEILAQFVWDLRVQIPGSTSSDPAVSAAGLRFNRQLPPWVEIRFKAVSPSAMPPDRSLLSDPAVWASGPMLLSAAPIQKAVFQHAKEFVTRIGLGR